MQRLLLVESGVCDTTRLKDHLTQIGYKISAIVKTAEQAIETAKIFDPDFIVMDFNIKTKSTGFNLYEDIRKHNSEIPILYMSAPAAW